MSAKLRIVKGQYYAVIFPIIAIVLGYLGHVLREDFGVSNPPTGMLIGVAALAGLLLPGGCAGKKRHHRPSRVDGPQDGPQDVPRYGAQPGPQDVPGSATPTDQPAKGTLIG